MVRPDHLPSGTCPRCLGTRILGPRVVKDGEIWCNCYACGHAWQVDRKKKTTKTFGWKYA